MELTQRLKQTVLDTQGVTDVYSAQTPAGRVRAVTANLLAGDDSGPECIIVSFFGNAARIRVRIGVSTSIPLPHTAEAAAEAVEKEFRLARPDVGTVIIGVQIAHASSCREELIHGVKIESGL